MTVATLISELATYQSAEDIPMNRLAPLTSQLITHESRPGGPYTKNVPADTAPLLNFHIVRLFSSDEYPLPGAVSFLIQNKINLKEHTITHPVKTPPLSPVYRRISQTITKTCGIHADPAHRVLEKIHATDRNGEISLLSTAFAKSIDIPVNKCLLEKLAHANIYTWMAFSLYDTIYDSSEIEMIKLTPLANCTLQLAIKSYQDANPQSDTPLRLLTASHLAHLEEMQRCRFNPQLPIATDSLPETSLLTHLLSARSIAHCTGPLMIHQLARPEKIKEHKALEKALYVYCRVRQLIDDLHDWQEDFSAGRWTYVTTHLAKKSLSTQKEIVAQYTASELLPYMKELFWKSEIKHFLQQALGQVKDAERSLKAILHPEKYHYFLDQTLRPLATSLKASQSSVSRTQEFITAFLSSEPIKAEAPPRHDAHTVPQSHAPQQPYRP